MLDNSNDIDDECLSLAVSHSCRSRNRSSCRRKENFQSNTRRMPINLCVPNSLSSRSSQYLLMFNGRFDANSVDNFMNEGKQSTSSCRSECLSRGNSSADDAQSSLETCPRHPSSCFVKVIANHFRQCGDLDTGPGIKSTYLDRSHLRSHREENSKISEQINKRTLR